MTLRGMIKQALKERRTMVIGGQYEGLADDVVESLEQQVRTRIAMWQDREKEAIEDGGRGGMDGAKARLMGRRLATILTALQHGIEV